MSAKLRIVLGIRLYAFAMLFAILFAAQGVTSAHAATWNLVDVTFDDGGTATGSFDYDAATNTYSNIDIMTTAGSVLPGTSYTFDFSAFGTVSPNPIFLTDNGQQRPTLFFDLASQLTDSGGTILLLSGAEIFAASASLPDNRRDITGGSISAVPLPPAVFLFGTALFGMAGFNRLKRRKRLAEAV